MATRRTRMLNSTAGALALLAALATGVPADAQDLVMFRDRVPSPSELANLLWPGQPAAAPAGVRTRSLVRTRAIRLDDGSGAPAPAAPSAGQRVANAGAAAPVQSDAAPAAPSTGFGFNIRFAFDSTEVLPESMPYLDQVGAMLQSEQARGQGVAILGHTDATGTDDYNANLSQRRAVAVAQYLVNRYGVTPERLQVAGLGERRPLTGTDPHDAVNRRVEFHAVQ